MSNTYEVGPCCLGSDCKHTDRELRPCHKCYICERIIHARCAIINVITDEYKCMSCKGDSPQEERTGSDTESVDDLHKHIENDKSVIKKMTVSVPPMHEEFTTIT